ncbi:hypothetical protein K504DRAFT_83489 [Pleomassaria siparia CBS 279.74]|uniref:Uncharacterized protein n=1 Tax=Pleomassaria siparia CBS 279.74 TaxID=1314801 RepID=A0A6G1JZJ8_9PLEO|nr:hypothetical protein K504DRAFT_83489 [Pleomassaria siparia CBS 279.74]
MSHSVAPYENNPCVVLKAVLGYDYICILYRSYLCPITSLPRFSSFAEMSTTSTNASVSSTWSRSSNENMHSPPPPPSSSSSPPPPTPHPYLAPGRASYISSWATSLPERSTQPHTASEADQISRDAAFEAYRQLKLAMFSRMGDTKQVEAFRPAS